MKNVKLTIEYEGTNYSGWQNQENAITIQQVIEKAIYDTSKEHTRLKERITSIVDMLEDMDNLVQENVKSENIQI